MKILHLSDLHIGGADKLSGQKNKGDPPCTSRCKTIVDNIINRCKPASDYVVVITGDVTDGGSPIGSNGLKKQYKDAATLINRIRRKGFIVLPVPGNHDFGSMGVHPNEKYGKLFREKLLHGYDGKFPILGNVEKTGLIEDIAFIGLNSMEASFHRDYYFGAQGKLGGNQLKRLQKLLDSEKVKKADARVVYLHHHPFNPEPNMELHDADQLMGALKGKNVNILLFGHNHKGWKWNGWWDIGRCYEAGTTTRKEGAAGYHRIMDPGQNPSTDYDGDFLGNLKPPDAD